MRLILLFVTMLQKYTLTLQIVWTGRCCFYHESKMDMTPQRLLTLKGSCSGSQLCTRSSNRLLFFLCEYYIQCSLFMHNMLLRGLSIRHMVSKWRAVNISILPGSVHGLKIDFSISEIFHKNFLRILREINIK